MERIIISETESVKTNNNSNNKTHSKISRLHKCVQQKFREEFIPLLLKLLQKNWRGRTISSLIYEVTIILRPKIDSDITQK